VMSMDAIYFLGIGLILGSGLTFMLLSFWKRRRGQQEADAQTVERLMFDKKLLMRSQDTVLLVLGEDHVIRLANKLASSFFGEKDIEGLSYKEVVKIPEIRQVIEEALSSQVALKKELQLVLDSSKFQLGEERSLWVNVRFLDEIGGRYARIYIQDNTEQYRAEQVRKDFIANASHELRTPLAIINGYIETLKDAEVLADMKMSQNFLSIMQKHGERIACIIEEMLVISKLESGVSNTLNLEKFLVKDCVEDCFLRLDSLIKERGATTQLEIEESDFTICADIFYWNQIFFNLIENAIKQNPDNHLDITVGCKQSSKTGKVVIWVCDNGVGIPASDLPFIFRRFYRVEKHHSQQKIKGTGLGLSIVKRAVEAHNGKIKCDSVPNKMTRFTIELPGDVRE